MYLTLDSITGIDLTIHIKFGPAKGQRCKESVKIIKTDFSEILDLKATEVGSVKATTTAFDEALTDIVKREKLI